MKKRTQFWVSGTLFILTVIVLCSYFWDGILFRIAPKAVLTSALSNVFEQLNERFEEDPLLILLKSIDSEGKYTADIELITTNELLGAVNYDMTVSVNGAYPQIYANGLVKAVERELDFSLYLDRSFMAVSSGGLTSRDYYGITYETFREDIQNIPFLSFFIAEKMIDEWEKNVSEIQDHMQKSYTLPVFSGFSEQDIQKILLGILALPCNIENRSLIIYDEPMECTAISYSVNADQIGDIESDIPSLENGDITLTFYLHENLLVKLSVEFADENEKNIYDLTLGKDPAKETIVLQKASDICDSFTLCVDTRSSDDCYSENWDIQIVSEGGLEHTSLCYQFQPSSGAMWMSIDEYADRVYLTLKEIDHGFQIESDDFGKFISYVFDKTEADTQHAISCKMAVSRGTQIETPKYKNLSQWTLDDLWVLLDGIGSLLELT